MSDYLSRLVERAGSAHATVRPVLPSLFEPVQAGGTFAAMPAARGTEAIFGAELDSEPTLEVGARRRAIRERAASMNSIFTAAPPSEKPQRSEESRELRSAGIVRVPVAEPETRSVAVESPVVMEPSTESPHPQLAIWPRTAQPAEAAQRQLGVKDVPSIFNPRVRAEPMPDTRPAAPALPLLNPVLPPVPRAPIASRGHTRATASFPAAAGPSPTPTIQVTIGRVEVRAIMPAVPVPEPRARSVEPKLSLDDYLRSRNGSAA
jgi:hypothetical protein